MSLPREKLDRLVERWETVQSELNSGVAQSAYVKLTKEFSELSPVVAAIKAYNATAAEVADLTAMANESGADREMAEMARQELDGVKQQLADLESKLQIELLPKDAADSRSAIPGSPRRHWRRRSSAIRRRPVSHVPALCRPSQLED